MKRWKIFLATAVLCVGILGGCASPADSQQDQTQSEDTSQSQGDSASKETKMVTDAYGEQIEIPAEVTSIVETGYAPISSLIYVVTGRSDVLSAMSRTAYTGYEISMWKTLEPNLDVPVAALLDGTAINFEELALYEPQVILCNQSVRDANAEQLEAIGVTPIAIKFGEFEDAQEVIRIVGEVFDCEDRAASLIDFHQDTLSYFEEKQAELPEDRPTALYVYSSNDDGTYRVYTGKHLASKMMDAAGYENVAEDLEESTIVSVDMEQILEWNPDTIFLSNFDEFLPEQVVNGEYGVEWQALDAIINQKVYKAPVGMYRWDTFCVETPLMVKWLGQVANPDIFTEYDIQEDIRNFYSEYMDYTLSDSELAQILHTEENIYLDLG